MNSMYGVFVFKAVENDTILKYSRDDFEKYISLTYDYIDSVLEVMCDIILRK